MTNATKFEVGKTYTFKNGTKFVVTDISKRSFDRALMVSYRLVNEVNDNGLPIYGDSTPNSLHHSLA